MHPESKKVNKDIPEEAARYLKQAYETAHSPDACVLMCAASIDAMLKREGLKDGSLYTRIKQALTEQLIPKALHDWAHRVRLDANQPRHADEDAKSLTTEDASRALEFAEAMANYLFVLPALMPKVKESDTGADGGT